MEETLGNLSAFYAMFPGNHKFNVFPAMGWPRTTTLVSRLCSHLISAIRILKISIRSI